MLVENIIATLGLHNYQLNWAQLIDFLAFVYLALHSHEMVLFI